MYSQTSESPLINAEIATGQDVLTVLKSDKVKRIDPFIRGSTEISTIKKTDALKSRESHLPEWILTLLNSRDDVELVMVSMAARDVFQLSKIDFVNKFIRRKDFIGLKINAEKKDEPDAILLLDLDKQESDEDEETTKTPPLYVKDILFQFQNEFVSIQKIQPTKLQTIKVFLTLKKNVEQTEDTSEDESRGAIGVDDKYEYMKLINPTGMDALMTSLHEAGHRWAMYFRLDKFSQHQQDLRQFKDISGKKIEEARLIIREISQSERLASIFGKHLLKIIKPKNNFDLPFEYALQTYDMQSLFLLYPSDESFSSQILKQILASRINRTEQGIRQIQEIRKIQKKYFEQLSSIVNKLGQPNYTRLLSGTISRSTWEIHKKQGDIKVVVEKNNNFSDIVLIRITLPIQGERTVFTVSTKVGILMHKGNLNAEQLIIHIQPGLYTDRYDEISELIENNFSTVISILQNATI